MKTLQEGLDKWVKKNNMKSPQEKHKMEKRNDHQRKEKLSDADMRELMGMNRPRYSRGKGGAFRQK
ncbi:hypothetical protein [Neobacillus niacini]|uniref:hypothetical protein n=1 Tax=Neobacillus niacini TaxID=86668 RepID=UPI002FFDF159